jgi:serine/threonine protein kinase
MVQATWNPRAPSERADEVVLKIARRGFEMMIVNELQKLNYLSRQGELMQQFLVASQGMFEVKVEGEHGLALVLDHTLGGTFEDRIPAGGIPEVDARPAFQHLFSALELLHAYGVVHCDIKPTSIFCDKNDDGLLTARLGNFGVSMFLDDAELVDSACGTPGFIAPELLLPSPKLTAKADCFSLGATLLWVVTGSYPFGTDGSRSTLDLNQRGFSADGTDLSAELQDLLNRLGGTDPRTRLSASAALAHPWFKVPQAPARPKATPAHPLSRRFG